VGRVGVLAERRSSLASPVHASLLAVAGQTIVAICVVTAREVFWCTAHTTSPISLGMSGAPVGILGAGVSSV
jgi:hypothetical protein